MDPYDQQKEDHGGFYLSMAVICGLVAIGAIMSGGFYGAIAVAVAALGVYLFWRSG